MTRVRHLSEEERHGLAEGSLDDDGTRDAEAHLAVCASCAADVTRLRSLMRRIESAPPPTDDLDSLWPGIRSRIESGKVVLLQPASRTGNRRRGWMAAGLVAAATIVALAALELRQDRASGRGLATTAPASLSLASDSARLYRDEATRLLDEMELRRATLPPATRTAIDDDLRTIDDAIKELEGAIAHDPLNPALRQLLASSYRQKVDLLERIGNAG